MKSIRIVCLLLILAITAAWAPAPDLSAAPTAPTSLTPASGLVIPNKTILTYDVTFTWVRASATSYQFQLSTNSTFTTAGLVVNDNTLVDPTYTYTLAPNKRYWFRVRALVNGTYSYWTTARYISTYPEPVESTAQPINGPILDVLRPTFIWDDTVIGAKTFDLQIFLAGANVATTTPKYSKTGIVGNQFTLPVSLVKGTNYKWRVRSVGAYGATPWFGPGDPATETDMYFTTPNLPATPTVVGPATGTVLSGDVFTATFDWKDVLSTNPERTLTYELQISTDQTFATVTYGGGTINTGIESRYAMAEQEPVVPLTTGTYYWRVRSKMEPGGAFLNPWYSGWTTAYVLKTQPRLEGYVRDELTGLGIKGATVKAGTLPAVTTDENGYYFYTTIPAGSRSVVITAPDYVNKTVSTTLVTGAVRKLDIKMSKIPYKVVLTWGATPRDLDANLWLPAEVYNDPANSASAWKAHIRSNYLGTTTAFPFVKKSLDDLNGYGPETILIQKRYPGKYIFAVYLNSYENTWMGSKAVVKVYKGSSTTASYTFPVPTNDPTGRWWHVFELDGATGVITPVNGIKDDLEFCPSVYDCINGEAVSVE